MSRPEHVKCKDCDAQVPVAKSGALPLRCAICKRILRLAKLAAKRSASPTRRVDLVKNREAQRRWRARNPDVDRARVSKWRVDNPEKRRLSVARQNEKMKAKRRAKRLAAAAEQQATSSTEVGGLKWVDVMTGSVSLPQNGDE